MQNYVAWIQIALQSAIQYIKSEDIYRDIAKDAETVNSPKSDFL